jgi:GntR family frlABCD operon transcriptional regulator
VITVLNSDSSIPLYVQLKQSLENDIVNGVYKLGQKIPNEDEFCKIYGVSRITVRKAVEKLINENMLIRQQGKGTFIKYAKVNSGILSMSGFTQSENKGELKRTARILAKAVIPAPPFIAEKLAPEEGAEVVEVKYLMLENDIPIMIDTSYLPVRLFPKIYEKIKNKVSIYKIMERDYKKKMIKMLKEFSIITADAVIASILNCPIGELLYNINKTIYDRDDKPIFFAVLRVSSSRAIYSMMVYNQSGFDDHQKWGCK